MSARYRIDVDGPGCGSSIVMECVDQESADAVARHKKRRLEARHGKGKVTASATLLCVPAAWDFGSGPLPLPEGKPLGDSFAPGSREYFEQVQEEARAIVKGSM